MKRFKYEWIVLEEVEDEDPTKEEIQRVITESGWNSFYCREQCFFLEDISKEIFMRNFYQWDIANEGDYVFIAAKEEGAKSYSVFRVALAYVMDPDVDDIYFEEDE